MTKRFGFTLAEVLITLGIIGVVAAMTIPTLMNNTSNVEFRTGFKKIISTLNQAVTMNVALDNTDFSLLTTGTAGATGSFFNMFTNRMNLVKTISAAAEEGAGGIDEGTAADVAGASNYALFFNDGMAFGFQTAATSCVEGSMNGGICSGIVDVNGYKKPNRLAICSASSVSVGNEPATACTAANFLIGDRFSVRMAGQEVLPNGNAARWTLYNN